MLTPAGLRDQWADELTMRLGLAPWVADPLACRRQRAVIPPGANAWAAHRLVVTSIDYVKQPEVLSPPPRVPWDLVVVDEAHNLGSGSDRRVAADALAADASRVLLVTATPHAGSDEEFASLCAVGARGATDERPAIVRRHREDVGLGAASRLRVDSRDAGGGGAGDARAPARIRAARLDGGPARRGPRHGLAGETRGVEPGGAPALGRPPAPCPRLERVARAASVASVRRRGGRARRERPP